VGPCFNTERKVPTSGRKKGKGQSAEERGGAKFGIMGPYGRRAGGTGTIDSRKSKRRSGIGNARDQETGVKRTVSVSNNIGKGERAKSVKSHGAGRTLAGGHQRKCTNFQVWH